MVDWCGIGEAYLRALDRVENVRLWNEILDKIAKWKFNTIRLAFTFPGITPNSAPPHAGSSSPTLDMMYLNDVLDLLNTKGYKAVIDMHNYIVEPNHDCVGWFGSPDWITDWLALVQLIKNNPAVSAYELYNEPFRNSSADMSAWYNFNWTTDEAWNQYKTLTEQIRQIDPVKPIVWGAPSCGIGTVPPQDVLDFALQNNIVFTIHPWSNPAIATTEEADALVASRIAEFKAGRESGFPMWNGECGVHYTTVTNPNPPPNTIDRYPIEKYYVTKLINECLANGFGFNWWLYTKNSWKTGSVDEILSESNYMKTSLNILPIVVIATGIILGIYLLR